MSKKVGEERWQRKVLQNEILFRVVAEGHSGELPLARRSNLKEKGRESCNSLGRRGQVSEHRGKEPRLEAGLACLRAAATVWPLLNKHRGGWLGSRSEKAGKRRHQSLRVDAACWILLQVHWEPWRGLYTEMTQNELCGAR